MLHAHVFCFQYFDIKFYPFPPKRNLVEVSDRWNNIVTSISSAISPSLWKEVSRIGNGSARISGNTPRPYLTAGSLAAWFEGSPLTFITQGQSCLTMRCLQKRIVWGRKIFCWSQFSRTQLSIQLRDLFGTNFRRVLVLVDNIMNWTVGSFLSMLLSDCLDSYLS